MRIYLFGAGASFKAGYPLAKTLVKAIEAEARNSPITNLSRAWVEWQKVRDTSSRIAKYLLYNSNPEVVLSLPELCEAARESEDAEAFGKARDIIVSGSDDPGNIWAHLRSAERALASAAIAATDPWRAAHARVHSVPSHRIALPARTKQTAQQSWRTFLRNRAIAFGHRQYPKE
jgi:hypothetical protein